MSMRFENNTNTNLPKFKGVVSQQTGHWGAQIYADHQRIWLGTFKTEIEAAMAYDSASIKIRTGDNQRNFPWSSITKHEPIFQSFHSEDEIVAMIKDGTYPSKFSDFLRTQNKGQDVGLSSNPDYSGFSCKLLFQKELTPSDVSKLNRLVVPKKYAVKYFPRIANVKEDNKEVEKMDKYFPRNDNGKEDNKEEEKTDKYFPQIANGKENNNEVEKTDEVHLMFKDRMNRQWKFRYCYWQSSQSYVFTRGWNRFVKENKLNANDTIAFYACESRKRKWGKEMESFWLIDIGFPGEMADVRVVEEIGENVDPQIDLCLRLGQQIVKEEKDELVEDQVLTIFDTTGPPNKRRRIEATDPDKATSFRLFGFQIN